MKKKPSPSDEIRVEQQVAKLKAENSKLIRKLEEAGVRAAFLNAIDAACKRSLELAQGGANEDD